MKDVYLVEVNELGVAVKRESFNWQKHAEGSFFFEVPEQEERFSLPTGEIRILFVSNLGYGSGVKRFGIHDIEETPELFRRLLEMNTKHSPDKVLGRNIFPDDESFVNINIQGSR